MPKGEQQDRTCSQQAARVQVVQLCITGTWVRRNTLPTCCADGCAAAAASARAFCAAATATSASAADSAAASAAAAASSMSGVAERDGCGCCGCSCSGTGGCSTSSTSGVPPSSGSGMRARGGECAQPPPGGTARCCCCCNAAAVACAPPEGRAGGDGATPRLAGSTAAWLERGATRSPRCQALPRKRLRLRLRLRLRPRWPSLRRGLSWSPPEQRTSGCPPLGLLLPKGRAGPGEEWRRW